MQFEAVETVIELRAAGRPQRAKQLVTTYVISEQMAERLTTLIFPHLQFEQPSDNKALLIVGNYGTGKSHLMSVISAVAEHADLAGELRNPDVEAAAQAIAGKFKVIRSELGATTMDLRTFVCSQLEQALAGWGVDYKFPARDQIPNHKGAFEDMMAAFQEQYPDQGLLLLVDEMLEYLKTRRDMELVLDLSFLREVGEVCKDSRFRFIGGVQELLFESPRFAFVADTLRRVKDRFEQVVIARTDVKYVVAERLLKKTLSQEQQIRAHLAPYAPFYTSMNERMEEFVRLFPVHPAYIDVFERVAAVEKRAILKTLSQAMKRMLDQDVPSDNPGLVAYDSYWESVRGDPSARADADVRSVIETSAILESRIENAFTRPAYRPMALRIIRGLSVHRLTTGDVSVPLGPTPEELRDGLCLYDPVAGELGGDPSENLLSQIETVLREIQRTVSGQFISLNPANRQVYLDLKKTEDYEALIDKRAETLDDEALDRYYFDALRIVLGIDPEASHGSGRQIWEYEVTWRERNAPRTGYLFFGAPNERPTAYPPRDFYLYFVPPFRPPSYGDDKKADEVFFYLMGRDDEFTRSLRRYGGALDLSVSASTQTKPIYRAKADESLSDLSKWLQTNGATTYEVSSRGARRPLPEWLMGRVSGGNSARVDYRELVNTVASTCLAPHFADQSPSYPTFSILITGESRAQAAQDALRWVRVAAGGTGVQTKQGAAVLDALGLLDGDRLKPAASPYAQRILELLSQKGQGQVLNRAELLTADSGIDYFVGVGFRLEPEWLAVILVSLVFSGDVVLSLPGKRLDATNLDQLTSLSVSDLVDFSYVDRPKDWNLPALKSLYEVMGLSPGLATQVTMGDESAVAELQGKVTRQLGTLVVLQQQIEAGLPFWGTTLLGEGRRQSDVQQLNATKKFLASLEPLNATGKFKNFRYTQAEVDAQRSGIESLRSLENLAMITNDLGPQAAYLSTAEGVLPQDHPWIAEQSRAREDVLEELRSQPHGLTTIRPKLQSQLNGLKSAYITTYRQAHNRDRLSVDDDHRKVALTQDERVEALDALASIDLMPIRQLRDFREELASLRPCWALTQQDLDASPICSHCGYRPALEANVQPAHDHLRRLDDDLDRLMAEWTTTLLSNLEDPTSRASLELLPSASRDLVEGFLRTRVLPTPLQAGFVDAARQVLTGLQKVTVGRDELREALVSGGSPCTISELRSRFDAYLNAMSKGKDRDKLRVVVE